MSRPSWSAYCRRARVQAMVGGSGIRDWVIFASYYNHAHTAHHQPGSDFKQLASLTALEGDAITPISFNGPRQHEVKGTS